MKVYWLDYHPAFNTIHFNDSQDYEHTREIVKNGKQALQSWHPFSVSLEDNNKPSDFLNSIGGSLIVSARAKELLAAFTDNIEFLPLSSDFECYILNVHAVLDCIDAVNSKEKNFGYAELAFFEDIVEGHDIFRVTLPDNDHILNEIYVSEQLKEQIEQNLKGFQLIEVWDSNFSWKQKEEKFLAMCAEVDQSLAETFDFETAMKFVKNNKGKQSYSGKWSLKVDEDNEILLGQLQLDGTYSWVVPYYLPPIILGLIWGIKEKRNLLSKLKDSIPFR